jgi:hypothetical protein
MREAMEPFEQALHAKLRRPAWRLRAPATVRGEHKRALGGKGEFAVVTLAAVPAESFSFMSVVAWPTRDNYDDAVREAAFDVLLCSGPHNATGIALRLDAIQWHDVDSCAVAFYWAARAAIAELANFDRFGYPRNFTWMPSN